jgi:hypothetical protein
MTAAHAKIYDDLKQHLRRLHDWSVERTPTGDRCIDLLPDEELFFINDLLADLEDPLTRKRNELRICRPGHAAVNARWCGVAEATTALAICATPFVWREPASIPQRA